jgi:hypothetical protein
MVIVLPGEEYDEGMCSLKTNHGCLRHVAGVATLTVRELFDFATDPAITEQSLDGELDKLMEAAAR